MTTWNEEFKKLDTLTREELNKSLEKLSVTQGKIDSGIFDPDFIKSLKEFIDGAVQLNQVYGVIKYTSRWKNGTKDDERNTGQHRQEINKPDRRIQN